MYHLSGKKNLKIFPSANSAVLASQSSEYRVRIRGIIAIKPLKKVLLIGFIINTPTRLVYGTVIENKLETAQIVGFHLRLSTKAKGYFILSL